MPIFERGRDTPLDVSPRPDLVEMWRNNLRKSLQREQVAQRQAQQSASINFIFDGVTDPPTTGMSGMIEITFPCRILACHIYAGNASGVPIAVTASVDLRLGQQGFWANGASQLWALTPPEIASAVEADIPVVSWLTNLEPGDLIFFTLTTFSGAAATWLALTLPILRLDLAQTTTATIVDSLNDDLVTDAGEPIVLRS